MGRPWLWAPAIALASLMYATPGTPRVAVAGISAARPLATATLTHQADGTWLLDYRFAGTAPAWFFIRSATDFDDKPWRAQAWTVETPHVSLARRGRYDVLSSDDGKPLSSVRIRVKPFAEPLKADYPPFLQFSDGGVAIYSGHFQLAPLKAAAGAEALPANLDDYGPIDTLPAKFTIKDRGAKLLMAGRRYADSVLARLDDESAYVYAGPAKIIDTAAFGGVVDPGLPAWVRTELIDFTPRLFALYADRLGPSPSGKPVAYVAWGGVTRPTKGVSMSGSVLRGTVVLALSGGGMAEPTPTILARTRWFLGHEASHFWLGQAVHYDGPRDAWITEGGADLMAIRALEKLTPGYDSKGELQHELDDCIKYSGANKPLTGASERNDVRANYACGVILLLAAESGAKARDANADVYSWLRGLIDASRVDATLDEADWLAHFRAQSGDEVLVADIKAFLDTGAADPHAFFARLFKATGIAFRREGDRLILA